jgi:prevent-host-death family protein
MSEWQMHEAKALLSEVVKCAESHGPQYISVHGKSVAVIVSQSQFDLLTANGKDLIEFMRNSPLYGAEDSQFERDSGVTRTLVFSAL